MGLFDRSENGGRPAGDPRMRFGLAGVAAVYLGYLGVNLIRGVIAGEASGVPGWVGVLIGIVFIGFAGGYLIYSYRSYKRSRAEEERSSELPECTEAETESDTEEVSEEVTEEEA